MQKLERLIAIEKIIHRETILSQVELMKRLRKAGVRCTQATLSRNLRQMGVLRIPDGKGKYRYSLPGETRETAADNAYNLIPVIRMMIDTKSMVLIKTLPGHASSVAVAIDNADRYEVAGTIAGDDTLLVIPRDKVSALHLHNCLEMIFPGIHGKIKRE